MGPKLSFFEPNNRGRKSRDTVLLSGLHQSADREGFVGEINIFISNKTFLGSPH